MFYRNDVRLLRPYNDVMRFSGGASRPMQTRGWPVKGAAS